MQNSACGLVLLNKTAGMTSQTAVNRVKRLFGVEKAGHTGTLDPMAEGVLPVLVGRAVKASEFLLSSHKHYDATLLLCKETDTEDTTGTVLRESDTPPTEEEVLAVCRRFTGELLQVPPMVSAIRVGGKRLMELARKGEVIEREPRPITVYSLTAVRRSPTEYRLSVFCSKGTYIRTLCADIGRTLGCGGCMASLLRTEAAGYPLSACKTLAELEEMGEEERGAFVLPLSSVFSNWEKVTLPPFFSRLAHNGLPIYLHKIGNPPLSLGTRAALYDGDGFFAIAEVREEEEGTALRPIRQF